MIRKACIVLGAVLWVTGLAQAAPVVDKPKAIRPLQAKPAHMPAVTSDRARAGASGYGEDPGEPTQERPNPLEHQSAEVPEVTFDRAKAGASGYGEDPGEPTQEHPNPMERQPAQRITPLQQKAPQR
ncbi:MAG: hypothetical protein ACLGHE_09200 [Gammaproteobacteria bacterium]